MKDYRESIEGWSQVHAGAEGCCESPAPHAHGGRAAEADPRVGGVTGVGRARRLLVCLDGVPLEVVRMARARGMFEFFREPSALLSPFPTMTNIALASMLRATPPHGYESLYFDREAREMRGGMRKYIGRRTPDKVPSSYMDELDYQEPLPFEFLIYVATDAVWRADMQRFRERFRAAPKDRDFFAFLKATDGLLHCRGVERLQIALASLDRILRDVRAECGDETEIVLFSDHGMNLVENRRIHLQTHLRAHGFALADRFDAHAAHAPSDHAAASHAHDRGASRGGNGSPDTRGSSGVQNSPVGRVRGRRRVAAPAFGLCGYAALYCGDETDPAEVAGALASLEGVDFSVYRDGADAVVVKGARGAARIRREEDASGARFAYEQLGGDPLSLAATVGVLGGAGELDARGFASDRAWLAQTAGHDYPDAVSNLFHSLHSPRVRHTADVLVSTLDGYYYGASHFSRMMRLLATHGNALRPSTDAFLMSTHRTFPAHVRATEAQPILRG